MRSLDEQQRLYDELWEQNAHHLAATNYWQPDPVPIYAIGIWLPDELHAQMQSILDELQSFHPDAKHQWLRPEHLHITLDLPGRNGTHFEEDDIPRMQQWLQHICKKTQPFAVELGNISCFTNVPFREVYDTNGNLFALHDAIAQKIPWSEVPHYSFENYVPHMSLLYPGEDATPILQHPDFRRELPGLTMNVRSLYLLAWYDGIPGTLEVDDIAIIELGTGKLLRKKHTSSRIPDH